MSPRKVADLPGASPTPRTRSIRPSSIASSSRQTLDGSTPINETRLSGSPRSLPNDVAPLAVSMSDSSKGKGKAKAMGTPNTPSTTIGTGTGAQTAQSKRVLPARLRRAAGGGQDGVRDLEEMIVDWLDRYGCPSQTPPENMRITITSLPLELVDPPPYAVGPALHTEQVTLTPQPQSGASSTTKSQGVIETPDWVMVKAGEDDQEEAREELFTKTPVSPVRRLRVLGAGAGDDHTEDTSDEHYIRLHKKYEAFEKRQRKDERDKLAFERYKMRTRIDLLRGMSLSAWSAVVWTVMAREDTLGLWTKGKERVKVEGVDWLRRRLVREGEEVMKRYDQLLPNDSKRSRVADSRNSTPARSAASASPPPVVLPARVAALKDQTTVQRRKSLPAHLNGDTKRKRQHSTKSRSPPPPKRKSTIVRTKLISATFSDSDSDPLSELSSESELENEGGHEQTPSEASTPASPASTLASASTSTPPARKITLKFTRTSNRVMPVKKPPTRTSARLSHVSAPFPATAPQTDNALDIHTAAPDNIATSTTNGGTNPYPSPSTDLTDQPPLDIDMEMVPKVEAEVTPDEQLEIDRVEAAVII